MTELDFFYGSHQDASRTATVANGETTVTFSAGVNLPAHVESGDLLIVFGGGGGSMAIVDTITDLTHSELFRAWAGGDAEEDEFVILPARQSLSPQALPAALDAYRARLRRMGREAVAAIASASSIDLGLADGELVEITGVTTITYLGSSAAVGARYTLVLVDGAIIEANSNIQLPDGHDFSGTALQLAHRGDGVWTRVA